MDLREIMTHDVQVADPGMTLREAANLMRDGDFGFLPVGDGDRLVGTITDRDITVRAVALGKDPNQTTVGDAMSEGVRYCFEDQTVDEVARVMADARIRRLPIFDRRKRLVGVVAIADMVTRSDFDGALNEALSGICER